LCHPPGMRALLCLFGYDQRCEARESLGQGSSGNAFRGPVTNGSSSPGLVRGQLSNLARRTPDTLKIGPIGKWPPVSNGSVLRTDPGGVSASGLRHRSRLARWQALSFRRGSPRKSAHGLSAPQRTRAWHLAPGSASWSRTPWTATRTWSTCRLRLGLAWSMRSGSDWACAVARDMQLTLTAATWRHLSPTPFPSRSPKASGSSTRWGWS
jgi:hypothetical protein